MAEDRSRSSDAEAIVLLHAGASTGDQWRGVQRALDKRYHLFMPDLFGDGRSPGVLPAAPEGLLAEEVGLIRAVIEGAGGRAHLVGHSYGGLAALRATLAYPGLVRSLVLFEPIAFDLVRQESCPVVFRELEGVSRDCDEAIQAGDLERAAQRFVDYWDEQGAYRGLPPATRALVASAMPKVIRAWHAIVNGPVDYGRIVVPTTVIEGGTSPAPARWMSEQIVECVRGARLARLENVGHMAPVTHPALVAREIARHLSTLV